MRWVKSDQLKIGDIVLGVRNQEKEFRARSIVLRVSEDYVDLQWSWGDMEWFTTASHEFLIE